MTQRTELNEAGQVVVTDEIRKALEARHARFKKTFGRDPYPTDPLIWDEDETSRPVPLPIDRSEIAFDKYCDAAEEIALIPSDILHAMRKTRLIITQENAASQSEEDLAAWSEALREYRKGHL